MEEDLCSKKKFEVDDTYLSILVSVTHILSVVVAGLWSSVAPILTLVFVGYVVIMMVVSYYA